MGTLQLTCLIQREKKQTNKNPSKTKPQANKQSNPTKPSRNCRQKADTQLLHRDIVSVLRAQSGEKSV